MIVLGILAIIGLLVGLFIVRPRRARRAQQLRDARAAAQDDLLALNQQITDRDSDVAIQQHPEAAAEQAAALAAYERGTAALDAARKPADMQAVSRNIGQAQYRLAAAQALAHGQPGPERRPACFFDPRHGLGPGLFTGFLLGQALSGPGFGYGWGGPGWGEPGWDGGPGNAGGDNFGGF